MALVPQIPEQILVLVRLGDVHGKAILALDSGVNAPVLFSMPPARRVLARGSVVGGLEQYFVALPRQSVLIGVESRMEMVFFAPVNRVRFNRWVGVDGLLPTALFDRVFISYAEHFVIFDPR